MNEDPLRAFRGIFWWSLIGFSIWITVGISFAGYRDYRKEYCEVSGCENTDVNAHHILPQVDFPEYADGQGGTNIITLCAFHHRSWAHYGDTTKYYNVKIRKMVDDYNSGKRKYKEAK